MQLDPLVCEQARRSRDARFDGRIFVGVVTTGIYCRPICPAPAPHERNVRYFASAAAAAAAGLRPCLRCRPEASPGTPAWLGTSTTVSRGLRLIAEGALDVENVDALAARLGVSSRHLRRLFLRHVGATPQAVALTRRVQFAKTLIDVTRIPFTAVAEASGFGSVRRFNSMIRRTYARTPTQLRGSRKGPATSDAREHRFRLAFRPPLDWIALLAFLRARATPGVEIVEDGSYRRTIAIGGTQGEIDVRLAPTGTALEARIRLDDAGALLSVIERIRRLFDLGAVPGIIGSRLRADPLLRRHVDAHPGLRVPGAWCGFELAVRAILGQQVAVRAASTLAGRLARAFGSHVDSSAGLTHSFPSPKQLADAAIESVGVVTARAAAIRRLARDVEDGTLALDRMPADLDALVARLTSLPGIGEWTAHYVAMRALSEPDAFPAGDLVLRRAAGVRSERELIDRARGWRPWRAYAAMLLWQGVTDDADAMVHGNRQPRRNAAARR